jgi:gentisate 1,2-dioxygenase
MRGVPEDERYLMVAGNAIRFLSGRVVWRVAVLDSESNWRVPKGGLMTNDLGTTLDDLERYLGERYLRGAGLRRGPESRTEPPPRSGVAANHWKWSDIYSGLQQSGRIVPVGPQGLTEMRSVTPFGGRKLPISMNAQILMPGERTRAHRNMKNETRLVWEAPPGAVFVCEYEAFPMERGDLIISPTWTYHDHYNPGTTPALWVDGYDNGYATLGEAGAALNDRFPVDSPYQEIKKADGFGLKMLGHVRAYSGETPHPLPPVRYPWADTAEALNALREAEIEDDPCEGLHLTFVNPVDGAPTLPTIAWHVQLLEGRPATRAHRHNSTTCYHVFQGEGVTTVEGERIEWATGDLFNVPPWTWHQHENQGTGDAILFSIDDWPAMTKLGFYKKEVATD